MKEKYKNYFKIMVKFLFPIFIISLIKKIIINYNLNGFKNLSNEQIFSSIYESHYWSNKDLNNHKKFNSGPGTENTHYVNEYLDNLSNFFLTLRQKPSVADLGCGDFEIGSKLVKYSSKYFAIDVYSKLINYNKKKFKNLNVNFLHLDITNDDLPHCDVYILRQVLQHLSNHSIFKFIKNIKNKCKYLVITEHIPDEDISNFIPNKDLLSGPYIRLHKNSGVVLTEKPFNLKVKNKIRLFTSRSKNIDGVLDTTLLEIM